jgi:hypothetical protein
MGLGGIVAQSEGRTRTSKGTMIRSGMPNLLGNFPVESRLEAPIADIFSSLTGQEGYVVSLV